MSVCFGQGMLEQLQKAGVLPPHVRRCVIDIPFNDLVHIYYDCIGDVRMLSVIGPESLQDAVCVHVEDMEGK
jgi:hypothetical protein